MSVIFTDGFDMYADGNAALLRGWNRGIDSYQTGRFGEGKSARLFGGNRTFQRSVPSGNTFSVGFALSLQQFNSFGTGKPLINFRNGGSDVCKLGVAADGTLKFGRGDWGGNNLGSSSAGLIVANTSIWNYIEVGVNRDSSAGDFVVKCNGATVISGSGVNTGGSAIDTIALFADDLDSDKYFDDLYITNTASPLGERRIITLRPTADTAEKDWTASSGSDNYAMVDESSPNGDTDYISSATSGAFDLYDLGNLPYTPASVDCVTAITVARKDDASLRQINSVIKSGSATADGATVTLNTAYDVQADIFATDPNTSGAWSATSVNAAQLGVEVV